MNFRTTPWSPVILNLKVIEAVTTGVLQKSYS